jgi:archaellum component FlaF (FlaF/FlaG flagellin family)
MGFSSIIATGIMVIVLLVTGYLIMATLNNAVDSANAAQATALDAGEAKLHTSLGVSSPAATAAYLDFNVTNAGETAIGDIASMDVIVKSIADGGVAGCLWLPYNDSQALTADHWYVLYQAKNAPGSATSLGAEDVMRVRCVFDSSAVPGCGEIAVAAPGGTVATLLYNIPIS